MLISTARTVYVMLPCKKERKIFESALAPLGLKIAWFSPSAGEALPTLPDEEKPIAVIVDLDATEKNGRARESELGRWVEAYSGCEVIGLSSRDSGELAVQCYRQGFAEFIVKPYVAEQITWAVRRCIHRRQFLDKLTGPEHLWAKAVAQISACTSQTQIRLNTLQALQNLLQAEGAAWVKDSSAEMVERTYCAVPRVFAGSKDRLTRLIEKFDRRGEAARKPHGVLESFPHGASIYIHCRDQREGTILLWGVSSAALAKSLAKALLVLEHTELCLDNLKKLELVKSETLRDDLTGLFNAKHLKSTLLQLTMHPKDEKHSFAVLFIDVDKFKAVNDQFGHLTGSECLVILGKILKHAVRDTDTVYRYGGDEFVVILHQAGQTEALLVAERIRRLVEERVFVAGVNRLRLTVSIGLAVYPEHAKDRETLLSLADEAMYNAKRIRRNAVYVTSAPRAEVSLNPRSPNKGAAWEGNPLPKPQLETR